LLRYEVSLGARSLDPILRVAAWSLNATQLAVPDCRTPGRHCMVKGAPKDLSRGI
jgi:hypothetical protein